MLAALFGTGLAITAAFGGIPEADDCNRLHGRYESAVAAITDALRTYEACVSASRAADACDTDFADLDVAQAVFERTVAAYAKQCARPRSGWERK